MRQALLNYINKIHPIDSSILEGFIGCWLHEKRKKKEVVTEANKREDYLYFVTKGIQKAYYVNEGKAFNIAFSYPYNFTCTPESFLTQQPSQYYWECITDSEFLKIKYSTFFGYVEEYPEFQTLLYKKLIGTLNGIGNRYHRLLTQSMEERFISLMTNSPQLINLIPQKEIANYLKIDPTNFSKLINSIKI
ncbi:Crp/Fnr family transcriptional regulator [Psychroserpens algicola]|uniref:Cyclic nucleotide-binding domain-containing protein n=1 Tax=Psychroserpens algicola TaxID=1719034 RepID=A0ABT0H5Y2_9FLAO|nr:cyclic nucleotide-binding domain-containing protein [Psychroserpens algicola]MCK8479778.1 cyclic nucleotide-binding domain-containing protein [Psychroserpens algicola]